MDEKVDESKNNKRKKRIGRKILIVLLCLVLLSLIMNLISYISLKKDKKKSLDVGVVISLEDVDSVDLVGLLDSYGVPYSAQVNESFMDLIESELNSSNIKITRLDLFNLYINKTWHVDGVLNNKVTINEMIEFKNFALDFVRHKYGDERIKTSLSYESDEENGDRSVCEYIKSLDNPVILYSCSANDLFYYYGTSLESLNAKRVIEIIKYADDGFDFLENNVKRNMDSIIACNPKAQIFVMGLYMPSDNFWMNRLGSTFINKINKRLKRVCEQYENVYYVDVSSVSLCVLEGDFHPDQDGQKIIANKLSAAISENLKPVKEYKCNPVVKNEKEMELFTADEFVEEYYQSDLRTNDYVEYATKIEWVLDQLDCKNISFSCLEVNKEEIISKLGSSIDIDEFEKGYEICVIEHKILDGMIEGDFSLHPETKHNDKLSLIDYYN